jgi:hypothetical protein
VELHFRILIRFCDWAQDIMHSVLHELFVNVEVVCVCVCVCPLSFILIAVQNETQTVSTGKTSDAVG